MIRDRLAAARARARRAALIRQSKARPQRSSGIHRLIDLSRSLMKVARDAVRTVRWRTSWRRWPERCHTGSGSRRRGGFIGVVARSRLVHRLRELTW